MATAARSGQGARQAAKRARRRALAKVQTEVALGDAKSIFAGGGRYRGSAEVREDQSGAVELRARQVPTEYRRNAREKDAHPGPRRLVRRVPRRGLR